MAILKRINKYQGLKDIDVLVEESGITSQYFNIYEVPDALPQGRSSFLLAGSPFLKNNVELKIEIIDSAGNTVYTEPVQSYLEGNARRVSVEIYDDTAPGDGFMYIVGELKDNYKSISSATDPVEDITDGLPELALDSKDVPNDFQNVYNVRYVRPIFINTTIPNSQPIFFYKQPRITVSEIVKGFVTEVAVSSSYSVTGSVEVNPLPDLPPIPKAPDPVDGFPNTIVENERDKVGAELEIFKNRRKSKIEPLRNNNFSSRGRIMRRFSPEVDRFTVDVENVESSPENDAGSVSSAFVGGNITINNPSVDTDEFPTSRFDIPTSFQSSIKKVNNNKTLVPIDDFFVTNKETGEKVPAKILSTSQVTMSVAPTPPTTISTTHFRSFADITLGNLQTFGGDVYKAKIYARSKGTLGDFEPIFDASIESPQVLIDAFSPTGFKNVGYFYTGSIITDYWDVRNGTAVRDDNKLIDSVLISGSNAGFTKGVGEGSLSNPTTDENTVIFETSHSYELEKNVPMTLEFNAYYYREPKTFLDGSTKPHAELEVYISGSGQLGTSDETTSLGKIKPDGNETEGQVLGIHNTFTTATAGDPKTRLRFKATAGRWIIQDVNLRPHSETNFSPDYFRTILPMPHPMPKKPDQYDFLVEFYDINNNIAETIIVKEDVVFAGAPVNIDGDGNLLSGSMYMGSTEGEGIELHGGSAYMRSIGYEGFNKTIASGSGGFLIFSGSIQSRLSSSEDYQGVGLEIVDAHGATNRFMKFRTNPSTFQVQTDEFFLGSTAQFVSGSNGNIEISSSNFHLDNAGNVTMAGTVTATAGNIGDFQIIQGQISGSNITMNATRSQIFKTDQGPGSDTGASLENLRNEYYIDFTPSESIDKVNGYRPGYYIKMGPNFMVDKDGILIASGATFEGSITASAGLIGGFTTDSHSFSSQNIFISGSPAAGGINQDKYMFISTSKFNVKQDGSVTGSEFLLEGGTITSDVTILGSVAANSILTPATIGGSPATVTNASSSIDSQGFAKFVSASIAGFTVNTEEIKSSNNALCMKQIGQITGSNVLFTGGVVGGFTLSSTTLSATNFSLDTSNKRISLGTGNTILIADADDGIQLGHATFASAPFSVTTGGVLKATSGTIGGWTLSSSTLTGGNVTLNSAGEIKVGSLANASTTATTNSGFFADNSGNVLIKGNVSENNYLKITGGGGIDIKSSTFDLDATTIILDSGTNNGKIALGQTPPTAYNSGNGFYVDGNANLLIGSASGDHIQFNATANTFDVQVGSLELDASNIEISSTNASMSLGEGNIILDGDNNKIKVGATTSKQVEIVGSSTQGYIATGKTSATSTTAGFWLANNNTDPEFNVGNATDFIKFDGGALDIASQKLEINANNFEVSSQQASMSLGEGKVILQGTGTPKLAIGPSAKDLSLTAGSGVFIDGDGNFKFGDADGNVTFNGGSFAITGSDVAINVTDINISSSGFEVSSTNASMSLGTNKQWLASGNGANPFLSVGQSTAGYGNTGIFAGYVSSVSRPRFSLVGSAGHIKVDSGVDIQTSTLELQTSGIEISSAEVSMSIGPGGSNPIVLQSAGNDRFLKFGGKTDFDQTTTAGFIMGIDNTVPKFDFTVGTSNNNYIRMNAGGVDIKTPNFILDTTNLDINSATSRIVVSSGSEFVRIGEISDAASDLYGMKIYDGTGTGSADTLVKLGQEGNEIAGWTISSTALTGGKMIIRQDGTIESSGFASNVAGSGFRLTAENGGFLEVENAKIRGTMATTVFEKESVNAVGGQLYVANSTTIKSGSVVTAVQTTMSVDNVTGFAANEVLSAKKISSTGFSTEYILVNSASRDNPSSETDFSGKLMVTRAYGSGTTGESGSLGDSPSTAVAYSGSQVLVSTGKTNTGYIRLNANPNDPTTPYIDIVERTGSAIYDVELKARLGDLSGISSGLLYGNTNPGFGLFTENVFLSGAITATTGSFTGIVHIGTSPSEEMRLGTDVNSTNDGLHINNNNYWYTTGAFKVGSSNFFLSNDSSGNIAIQPKELNLQVSDGSGGHKLEIAGTATEQSMSFNNRDVVFGSDGTRGFGRIGRNISKAIQISGSQTDGVIRIAKDSYSDTTNGFWLANNNGVIEYNLGGASEFIKFKSDTGLIDIASTSVQVTASNVDISTGVFKVDADDYQVQAGVPSVAPSMSLGYDTNSNIGMEFVGGSPTTIKFGPKASPKMLLQSDTQDAFLRVGSQTFTGTEGGIIIGNDNGTSKLKVHSHASSSLVFDGTDFDLRTTSFRVKTAGGFDISGTSSTGTSNFLKLGSATSATAGEGVYLDGGGNFRVGTATSGNSFMRYNPTSEELQVKTSNLNIDTTTMDIVASGSATRLSMGASPPTNFTSNGIIVSGSGFFNFQSGASQFLRSSGDGIELQSARLSILTTGTNKIKIDSTATTPVMAMGSTLPTSATSGTGFFVDGAGNFLLGNASGNHLKFNSSTGNLDVIGTITIGASSPAVPLPDGLISGSAQIAADISGSTVLPGGLISGSEQIADEISGSFTSVSSSFETSVSASQASADTVSNNLTSVSSSFETSVSASQASADTVAGNLTNVSSSFETTTAANSTAASNAQNAVDLIGSQLILSASGMTLRSTGQSPDFDLARFGTTTKIFDGVGSSESNRKLQISSAGVFVFGDDVNTYAYVRNSGVQLVEDGTERANFASTTTIGNTSNEHIRISGSGLELKDGSNVRLSMSDQGMQIGSVANGITLNSSGDATFNGTLTITGGDIAGLTGSLDTSITAAQNAGDNAQGTANTATANALEASASAAAGVSGSVNALTNAATAQSAIDLMETRVVIDNTGMALKAKNDAGVGTLNGQTIAEYGTTTTLFDGVDDQDANKKLEMNASGITLFGSQAGNDFLNLASNSIVMKTNNLKKFEATDSGVFVYGLAEDDYVNIKSDGVDVVAANSTVAQFGSTTIIGSGSTEHVEITNSSLKLKDGSTENVSISGTTVTIGSDTDNRVTITPTSMQIGSIGGGITMDANGDATFNGSITITGPQIAGLTGSLDTSITAAQNTATNAQSGVTSINATTSSLENPTQYAFGGNAFSLTTNTPSNGLNLTATHLGYSTGGTYTTYMDSSGNFYLGGTSGALTWTASTSTLNVNRITATTGTIGAFDIGSNTLESANDKLILDGSSDGKIRLGSSPPTAYNNGTGIFLGGDGTFLVGASAGNKIQFDGSSIVMASDTFTLNTTTMILDSTSNSGTVRLGASGGPSSEDPNTSARGVYMDGGGDVLFKATTTANQDYLKFTSSGLELQTSTLKFTTDGNIESNDFLVERSRLFGAGADGDGTCTTGTGGSAQCNRITNTASNTWTLQADIYARNLTVNSSVILETNGFRLFVQKTLTNNGTIRNNGSGGTSFSQTQQAGGIGNTLVSGSIGTRGGDAGVGQGSGGQDAGRGGAGGGGGGIVLIFCRTYTGSGTVESKGGRGRNGESGKLVV